MCAPFRQIKNIYEASTMADYFEGLYVFSIKMLLVTLVMSIPSSFALALLNWIYMY
jgi:hypothetical protein